MYRDDQSQSHVMDAGTVQQALPSLPKHVGLTRNSAMTTPVGCLTLDAAPRG